MYLSDVRAANSVAEESQRDGLQSFATAIGRDSWQSI